MELLKLSKFKLQLQSMIGEVRDLRVRRQRFTYLLIVYIFRSLSPLLPAILQERERSVTDHLNLINQVTESMLALVCIAFLSRES